MTRWLAPNRYATPCVRCGEIVPPGVGQFRLEYGRWVVRHYGARCHTREYTRYISRDSAEWQKVRAVRSDFARHRCEWRTFPFTRCPVTGPLECHHRHYDNLGNELLGDLVMLCPPHHAAADRLRRVWGSWPLFGRPFWRNPPAIDRWVPSVGLPGLAARTGIPPPSPEGDDGTGGRGVARPIGAPMKLPPSP